MTHSFIAYIDESGDDGLPGHFRQPGKGGGPSNWLTIGATVWRRSLDLEAVRWAKEIRSQLSPQQQKGTLHFKEMRHEQRVMAINSLATRPLRIVAVSAHKPSLDAARFSEKNQLYSYVCRYLIERLSWLCRELRPRTPEGDGRLKIIFSRRKAMSYEDFRSYMQHLRDGGAGPTTIAWPIIDVDGIEAQDHGARFGLQLADLAMSGLTWALEPDFYGNVEPRFARTMKPLVYNKRGNFLSYGAKIMPAPETIGPNPPLHEYLEIFS